MIHGFGRLNLARGQDEGMFRWNQPSQRCDQFSCIQRGVVTDLVMSHQISMKLSLYIYNYIYNIYTMYVFLCLHRYKHISYILYKYYIYICIIETCFSFWLPGGVVWWFSQKRCVGSEGKTIQQWDIQPKVPGLSSTFKSQLPKNSFTNPHSSIHYTSQSRNCNPGFVSPLTA